MVTFFSALYLLAHCSLVVYHLIKYELYCICIVLSDLRIQFLISQLSTRILGDVILHKQVTFGLVMLILINIFVLILFIYLH